MKLVATIRWCFPVAICAAMFSTSLPAGEGVKAAAGTVAPAENIGGGRTEDGLLLYLIGISEAKHHQETVELSFSQRVRAMLFDRVLGREHNEGCRKLERPTA